MPYLEQTESDKLPVFYNVTNAVRKNAPNQKDDVALLQYYLPQGLRAVADPRE